MTYAAADFNSDGSSFTPLETALTCPEDYEKSGQNINQSLDYVFLFPPTHEQLFSPNSNSILTTIDIVDEQEKENDPTSKFLVGSPLMTKLTGLFGSPVLSPRSSVLGQSSYPPPYPQYMHDPLSPDSRALRQSVIRPESANVRHLDYIPNPRNPKSVSAKSLKFLSDHLAVETVLRVGTEQF